MLSLLGCHPHQLLLQVFKLTLHLLDTGPAVAADILQLVPDRGLVRERGASSMEGVGAHRREQEQGNNIVQVRVCR